MLSHNLLQWWMNPCLYQGTLAGVLIWHSTSGSSWGTRGRLLSRASSCCGNIYCPWASVDLAPIQCVCMTVHLLSSMRTCSTCNLGVDYQWLASGLWLLPTPQPRGGNHHSVGQSAKKEQTVATQEHDKSYASVWMGEWCHEGWFCI